jgi:hypothetical protein
MYGLLQDMAYFRKYGISVVILIKIFVVVPMSTKVSTSLKFHNFSGVLSQYPNRA